MRWGAILPQIEVLDPKQVRTFIESVEAMGYDHLLAYDHVVGANPDRPGGWDGPYTHTDPFHEVFTLMAYAAAITTRIELVTGVLILPQRQAVLAAKQAAQVDVFSNGRLRLGIGVGWNKVEMEALGEDFSTRGRRSAEQVEVMQQLWTNERVIFAGDYHKLDDVGILPMPVQRPIPVWFGGGADAVMRRMARLGQGWMPGGMSPERAQDRVEKLREYLPQNGRSLDDFGIDPFFSLGRIAPDDRPAYIDAWRELGATHMSVVTMGQGYTHIDQHLEDFQAFIDFVS